MTGKELVGPVVWFRGDREPGETRARVPVVVDQAPPADTRDPRYLTCVDHHLACDCREAELAEDIHEWRASFRQAQAVAGEVCAGHPTWPEYYTLDFSRGRADYVQSEDCCQCTGCQIIRKAHL
jgi:hypothetical protein